MDRRSSCEMSPEEVMTSGAGTIYINHYALSFFANAHVHEKLKCLGDRRFAPGVQFLPFAYPWFFGEISTNLVPRDE